MLATVDVPQDEGCEGGTEGGEAEDEHRGLVGGIGLVGLTNEHRDDVCLTRILLPFPALF